MPDSWKEGLIFFITKKDVDLSYIKNWRPITFLNTIYKMYGNTIALRLQTCLDSIIQVGQTGFMQNHSIFYNIFLFFVLEAMEHAKEHKEDLAILMLDFEKAYDQVDWDFSKGTMCALGLARVWIKGVEAMYKSTNN